MPGGGGCRAPIIFTTRRPATWTVIEVMYDNMPSEQALGLNPQVRFDARQPGRRSAIRRRPNVRRGRAVDRGEIRDSHPHHYIQNRAYYNDWEHQIRMARLRGTDEAKAHIGMDL